MKKKLILLILCIATVFLIGHFYFHGLDGFTLSNIASNNTHQPQWEVRSLTDEEHNELNQAIDQPYDYFGKGCQSYVFLSRDGQYVIKFIKQKHFRLQTWTKSLPPLPAVTQFQEENLAKRRKKQNELMQSCKVAFENLKEETALVFVHLNKTSHINKKLIIYDKIGMKHSIDLDQFQFFIQRRATLLSDILLNYKREANRVAAAELIDHIYQMIQSEFSKGIIDNDDAIVQNTGVVGGKIILLDIGQIVVDENYKNNAEFRRQKLFSKIYRLKEWLREHYPELEAYVDRKLAEY